MKDKFFLNILKIFLKNNYMDLINLNLILKFF